MSGQNLPELRARLTTQKQQAADMIVYNEFLPPKDQLSYEELAEELGIGTRTLYNWRQEADFIRYMSLTSDRRLASARAKADAQLMKLVEGTSNNGIPSVKGLELYYDLIGRKRNAIDLNVNQNEHRPRKTVEEVGESIDALNAMLDDANEED